jgi:hypothetical protein
MIFRRIETRNRWFRYGQENTALLNQPVLISIPIPGVLASV